MNEPVRGTWYVSRRVDVPAVVVTDLVRWLLADGPIAVEADGSTLTVGSTDDGANLWPCHRAVTRAAEGRLGRSGRAPASAGASGSTSRSRRGRPVRASSRSGRPGGCRPATRPAYGEAAGVDARAAPRRRGRALLGAPDELRGERARCAARRDAGSAAAWLRRRAGARARGSSRRVSSSEPRIIGAGVVTPFCRVAGELRPALRGRAVHDELVDDVVGDRSGRGRRGRRRSTRPTSAGAPRPARATRGTWRTPARSGTRRSRAVRRGGRRRGRSVGQHEDRAPRSPCRHRRAGTTVRTSSAESQLMMAPSPSRPARRSIPGRSAATRIGGISVDRGAEAEALAPRTSRSRR